MLNPVWHQCPQNKCQTDPGRGRFAKWEHVKDKRCAAFRCIQDGFISLSTMTQQDESHHHHRCGLRTISHTVNEYLCLVLFFMTKLNRANLTFWFVAPELMIYRHQEEGIYATDIYRFRKSRGFHWTFGFQIPKCSELSTIKDCLHRVCEWTEVRKSLETWPPDLYPHATLQGSIWANMTQSKTGACEWVCLCGQIYFKQWSCIL